MTAQRLRGSAAGSLPPPPPPVADCRHQPHLSAPPAVSAASVMQGPPAPPQKLNVQLEGLGAYQEGAAALQAGTPLAVREEGARLVCVTQSGAPVGLIPADKRGVLSRGPWSGTVRSVKRQAAPPPAAGQQPQPQPAEPRQPQQEGQQEGQPAAEPAQGAAEPAPAEAQQQEQQQRAAAVVQVLVRFTPEEQRWQARQPEGGGGPQGEELDTALLSTEQYEALGEGLGVEGAC